MIAPRTRNSRSPASIEIKRHAREMFPGQIAPMLATLGSLPADQGEWAFEFKWDGVRALCYLAADRIRIESRNLIDVTDRYPELHGLPAAVAPHALKGLVLDGEIVALDENHRPNFGLLQSRMHIRSSERAARLSLETPVVLMAFDILMHNGNWLLNEPYQTRRSILESLELDSSHWQTPLCASDSGAAMLEAAKRLGLEGVIAKQQGSGYQPGARSSQWRKVKIVARQAFVIAGYQKGSGAASGGIGALLLGYHEDGNEKGQLRYAGKVGTGFSDKQRRQLLAQLEAMRIDRSPFADRKDIPRGSKFVQPEWVADIEFRGWTPVGRLRQPAYKGLRSDKPATAVTRQRPVDES